MLTHQLAHDVVSVYIKAWTTQDPDLILECFTEDATYHERVLDAPIRGHSGIRSYWQTKVMQDQGDITCELLSLYVDGDTAIAIWDARFMDYPRQVRKHMQEIAVLEFRDGKIQSLKEFWASETI